MMKITWNSLFEITRFVKWTNYDCNKKSKTVCSVIASSKHWTMTMCRIGWENYKTMFEYTHVHCTYVEIHSHPHDANGVSVSGLPYNSAQPNNIFVVSFAKRFLAFCFFVLCITFKFFSLLRYGLYALCVWRFARVYLFILFSLTPLIIIHIICWAEDAKTNILSTIFAEYKFSMIHESSPFK